MVVNLLWRFILQRMEISRFWIQLLWAASLCKYFHRLPVGIKELRPLRMRPSCSRHGFSECDVVLAGLQKPLTPGLLQQCWAGYGIRPGELRLSIPDIPMHTGLASIACPSKKTAKTLSPFLFTWPQFNNLSKTFFEEQLFFSSLSHVTLWPCPSLGLTLLKRKAVILAFHPFDILLDFIHVVTLRHFVLGKTRN